jgi:uncharacterized LabA/DUF88 family protein
MERIAMFLDLANLEDGFRRLGERADYVGLRDYLAEGRILIETFVYLPLSPYHPERKRHLSDFFERNGFLVCSKIGKSRPGHKWACSFNVEMAVDILHYAHGGRVDIIVIGSGHADMLPICEELRWRGVRCEIAATKDCAAEELLIAASGFIDLGTIIREQREELIQNGSQDPSGTVPGTENPEPIAS